MNMWADAVDDLNRAERLIPDDAPFALLLQIAQIKALLSISQELSKIHHEGINSEFSHGE